MQRRENKKINHFREMKIYYFVLTFGHASEDSGRATEGDGVEQVENFDSKFSE